MKKRSYRAQKVNEVRWEELADRVKDKAVLESDHQTIGVPCVAADREYLMALGAELRHSCEQKERGGGAGPSGSGAIVHNKGKVRGGDLGRGNTQQPPLLVRAMSSSVGLANSHPAGGWLSCLVLVGISTIDKICERLLDTPEIGSQRGFYNPTLDGLRRLPLRNFENYLIFYRTDGDEKVEVIRVVHGARHLPALFE